MDKTPVVPKPAFVEDEEPAPVAPKTSTETLVWAEEAPSSTILEHAEKEPESLSQMQHEFEKLDISKLGKVPCPRWDPTKLRSIHNGYTSSIHNNQERARMNDCSSTEIPVTRGTAARDKWFADLAGLSAECNGVYPNRPTCPAFTHPIFSVYCNNCNASIPDAHYHCSTCDNGDFDLCQTCVASGVECGGEDHWMIKRFVKNGKVINSTTERIAPKPKPKEAPLPVVPTALQAQDSDLLMATRTCNSCIQGMHNTVHLKTYIC